MIENYKDYGHKRISMKYKYNNSNSNKLIIK